MLRLDFVLICIILSSCYSEPSPNKKNSIKTQQELIELENNLPDGIALYNNHCLGCHGSLEKSAKINKTKEDIQQAIGSIPAMSGREDLKLLTMEDLAAISKALAAKNEEQPKQQQSFLLGNRFYVESIFVDLFTTGDAQEDKIQKIITENIRKQGRFFGGTCSLQNESNCYSQEELDYDVNPNSQVVRQGLIAKTCDEVLQQDLAISNLLQIAGVDINSEITKIEMEKVFKKFSNGIEPNHDLTKKLLDLSLEAGTLRRKKLDSWRIPMIAICQSAIVELI